MVHVSPVQLPLPAVPRWFASLWQKLPLLILSAACLAGSALSERAAAAVVLGTTEPRVAPGAVVTIDAAASSGESLPDELVLLREGGAAGVVARATRPSEGGRRQYTFTVPDGWDGPVVLQRPDAGSSKVVMLVARANTTETVGSKPAPVSSGGAPGLRPISSVGQKEIEPPLSEHEPMYFLVGRSVGSNTSKYQFSFKYRLFDEGSGWARTIPALSNLYFAYTQTSLWDLTSRSRPFRDTSYRPSFFSQWNAPDATNPLNALRYGFEHESNGRAGIDSRSINTLFIQPIWKWSVGERSLYFHPNIYGYVDKEDNPDIQKYRGYVDWNLRFEGGGGLVASTKVRYGTAGRGSLQLDLAQRTRALDFGRVGGHLLVQLFSGYGENILDYNRRTNQLRVGVAIVP